MDRDEISNRGESSSKPRPPFRRRLYEVVDDPSTDSIVSWSESGKSFIVWNESEFCRHVLPRLLQTNDFLALEFKLNIMEFREIESEQWEYASDYLVRGQPELALLDCKRPFPPELEKELKRQMKQLMAYRARDQAEAQAI